jgi:hypothetical protein
VECAYGVAPCVVPWSSGTEEDSFVCIAGVLDEAMVQLLVCLVGEVFLSVVLWLFGECGP